MHMPAAFIEFGERMPASVLRRLLDVTMMDCRRWIGYKDGTGTAGCAAGATM